MNLQTDNNKGNERQIVAKAINAYNQNKSAQNKAKLREAIAEAYNAALESRMQSVKTAQSKGTNGGARLLEKMKDSAFLEEQFSELTAQRNLYGRIDRIISFGSNTADEWTPHQKQDSLNLSTALKSGDKNATTREFNALYDKMLKAQDSHLQETKQKLDSLIDECLDLLTKEMPTQNHTKKSPKNRASK